MSQVQALQTIWEEVVATALLGSDRRPITPLAEMAGDRLGRVLAGLDGSDPGRALLGAAGTLALYRRVGRLPASDAQTLPEPSPPDETSACSPRAAEHLKRMLAGEHIEVLPEWLAALAATGRRAPEECLVSLLERGRSDRKLRPRIAPVLGRRGEWLAARNPEWAFERNTTAKESDWETGTPAERVALLERLRANNPDRARALVESTWAEDTPEDRWYFLATFHVRLSMADEPFLESALDDRRKDIRTTAADLLARIPESRLVARMKARTIPVLALVQEKKSLKTLVKGKKSSLEPNVPDECDKALIRDGIEPKLTAAAKGQKLGEKAWRLLQMLGAVPPSTWTETFGMTPEEMIAVAGRGDWNAALCKGWALATRRFRDPSWAEALLDAPRIEKWQTTEESDSLLALLDDGRREAIVLRRLRDAAGPLSADHPALPLLRACGHAWSPEFSRTILDRVRKTLKADSSYTHYHMAQLIPQFGRSIAPGLAIEAGENWPTEGKTWAYWSNPVNALVSLLQFRHEMLTELAS